MKDLFLKFGKNISPLDKYKSNIYSQNGEDGVIEEILIRLGINNPNQMCVVEFGAWDGKHLSNTFLLVEKGASAVFIEGNESRYKDLLETCKLFNRINPVLAFVDQDKNHPKSLQNILISQKVPKDFDILSIDIDSYDLDIWESFEDYRPSIVVIEINSSFPPGVFLRHSSTGAGNSFSATVEVAEKKDYKLLCHIGNLIFVRSDKFEKFSYPEEYSIHPERLFNDFWINMSPGLRFFDWVTSFIAKHLRW